VLAEFFTALAFVSSSAVQGLEVEVQGESNAAGGMQQLQLQQQQGKIYAFDQ
jgi:hypothetical protein